MPKYGRTHLTIDLDFFLVVDYNDRPEILRDLISSIKVVQDLGVPIVVKEEHHLIIDYLNRSKFDTIINVDWHSDLIEAYDKSGDDISDGWKLCDGTWPVFYKHRKNCRFEWWSSKYSGPDYMGYDKYCRCDSYDNDSFDSIKGLFGFRAVSRKVRTKITKRMLSNYDIKSVSIVFSDDYWDNSSRNYELRETIETIFPFLRLKKKDQ